MENSAGSPGLGAAAAGATTAAEANAVLERFRPDYNRRFAVSPVNPASAWRAVRRGTDLERVCSFYYEATVLNDNTVHLGGVVVIGAPPGPRKRSYAKESVEVRQFLDGTWRMYLGEALIAIAAATTTGELRALRRRRRSPSAASAGKTPVALRAPSVSPAVMIPSP